jgi:comEA protein
MKRRLFYLIERLQVTRSERIAVSILMVITVVLSCLTLKPDLFFSNNYHDYSEADSIFAARSALASQEEADIMARYTVPHQHGIQTGTPVFYTSEPDTIEPDTIVAESRNSLASSLININTATAEKLQELPGIGPAYASRIIEWRERNGLFKSKEQLMEIRGIGVKRLEQIRPLISLDE